MIQVTTGLKGEWGESSIISVIIILIPYPFVLLGAFFWPCFLISVSKKKSGDISLTVDIVNEGCKWQVRSFLTNVKAVQTTTYLMSKGYLKLKFLDEVEIYNFGLTELGSKKSKTSNSPELATTLPLNICVLFRN